MRFWLKTFRLILVYALLAATISSSIYFALHHFTNFGFITISLLACVLFVTVLYLMFYVVVYKKKYYTIADNYIESVDLLQNCVFFVCFPYLGIVLSQVDAAPQLSLIREMIVATLLTFKITMLIIKYTVKHEPLATLDD